MYRNDLKVRRLLGGSVKVTRTRSAEDLSAVLEKFSAVDISNIVKQPKLKIALDLFNAYFYEVSDSAKFLMLIMVLETLKTKEYKHKIVVNLLDRWKEEIDIELEKIDKNTNEYQALSDLHKDVMFKKESSLKSQVRTLVRETLQGNEKADEYVKTINKLYDKRSRLVHDGELPSDDLRLAIEQARTIVVAVLRAKLTEAIK